MQLFIVTAALFAGFTLSQNLTQIEDLPACGQTCINNMLGKAQSLGCSTTDYVCLCKNMNFGFGVRDCSIPVCSAANPPVNPSSIISVGMNFCSEVEAASASGSSTTTIAQTVLSGTTSVSAGASGASPAGTGAATATATGSSSSSTNGTSGTNGTEAGGAGGKVVTTTNSLGSTTTSTLATSTSGSSTSSSSTASSSSSSDSGSSSSTGTATGTSTSATSSKKSEAGRIAACGFVGLAGVAAYVLLL